MIRKTGLPALILAGIVPLTAARDSTSLRLQDKSHTDSTTEIASTSGSVTVNLREVQTEIPRSAGADLQLSVLVIFEPSSGAFSWRATPADPDDPSWRISEFKNRQAAYLKNGTIVDIRAMPNSAILLVHEYRDHASSLDDAEEKALAAASRSVDPEHPLKLDAQQHVQTVPLPQLGVGFVSTDAMSAVATITPKVTDVMWDGKHWSIDLLGRWKERIVLDSSYAVISMRKIEP
ncbi:MAG TPA: hypothetical protein VG225_09805 [Terracidiphilus sp.]|jgi:hypothetical protein|nr:hypothetical protein [Terracidiphilus sp.]